MAPRAQRSRELPVWAIAGIAVGGLVAIAAVLLVLMVVLAPGKPSDTVSSDRGPSSRTVGQAEKNGIRITGSAARGSLFLIGLTIENKTDGALLQVQDLQRVSVADEFGNRYAALPEVAMHRIDPGGSDTIYLETERPISKATTLTLGIPFRSLGIESKETFWVTVAINDSIPDATTRKKK